MEIFIGICLGILYAVSIIVAFMVGYGWDKNNQNTDEKES